MLTRTSAPAMLAISYQRQSAATRLEPVSSAHTASREATLRVLIASHQPIVRHGLRVLIASEPDLQLVGEADDGSDAVRMARQYRPDVVLIDLAIPTVDGTSATRIIRAELRDTHVVVMADANADA